jgi:hypothetical protein
MFSQSAPDAAPDAAPVILGETSPASPLAGSFWTITLLVDHPVPEDLEVLPPPLPPGMILDRVRIEPRVISSQDPDRRWTALQYRYLVRNPGRIDLSPFEVLVQGTPVLSPAYSVTVRPVVVRPAPPRLFWRDPPASLTVGVEARLVLCVSGRNLPEFPATGAPLPPVPPMAIMESVPLQDGDEVLAFRVIPLVGPSFILPAFSFPLGTTTLQVPALRIPVSEAKIPLAEKTEEVVRVTGQAEEPHALAPFPLDSQGGSGSAQGNTVAEKARTLWEGGQGVEALAELRRNERDHPAGFTLVKLRRDTERLLALEAGEDEIWRPRTLMASALVLCLILGALCFILPALLRNFASRKLPRLPAVLTWGMRVMGVGFTVVALFCLFRLSPMLPYRGRSAPQQALSRETTIYRVPEDTGTGIARFREGQGILVYEIRDGWAYAESVPVGRGAGWVKAGTYVTY